MIISEEDFIRISQTKDDFLENISEASLADPNIVISVIFAISIGLCLHDLSWVGGPGQGATIADVSPEDFAEHFRTCCRDGVWTMVEQSITERLRVRHNIPSRRDMASLAPSHAHSRSTLQASQVKPPTFKRSTVQVETVTSESETGQQASYLKPPPLQSLMQQV